MTAIDTAVSSERTMALILNLWRGLRHTSPVAHLPHTWPRRLELTRTPVPSFRVADVLEGADRGLPPRQYGGRVAELQLGRVDAVDLVLDILVRWVYSLGAGWRCVMHFM